METETETFYKCGICCHKYNRKDEALACEQKHEEDKALDNMTEFEIKQYHLDLLKNMNIGWDDCEFGAPCVDPKRPYGNSSVEEDIAEIIKLNKKDNWNYREEEWKEEALKKINRIHKEMQIVLEIVLHCQAFDLGRYKREDIYEDWRKA